MINDQYDEHVKKWKLNELEEIIDEFDNFLCQTVEEKEVKLASDYLNILLFMAGKCIVTMREIICLVKCGYPDGALSLSRNLYEQYILSAFFKKHKADDDFQEYVDDFWLDNKIQCAKINKYNAEFVQMNEDEEARIDGEINELRKKAHHDCNNDYWWTGKRSFKKVADEIISSVSTDTDNDTELKKYLATYYLMYKRACVTLHASSAGNSNRLGSERDFVGIDNRRHESGHQIPLQLATQSFVCVLDSVCEELGIDAKDWIERLSELLGYYWRVE